MRIGKCIAAVAAVVATLTAADARAAYTITYTQVGANVVATGSGSLNVSALYRFGGSTTYGDRGRTNAAIGQSLVAPGDTFYYLNLCDGIIGPSSFGPGGDRTCDVGTGPIVGVVASNQDVVIPFDYVSGSNLGVSTSTYLGTTIAGMGLTPGRYGFTWGSGATADSLTVVIPEPAAMATLGLAGATLAARRRRR